MRPLLTVLIAAAIVGIAAGVARGFTAYYGAIYLSNIQTPNQAHNPHATTNGLVWIDTGTGPVLNQQEHQPAVAVRPDYRHGTGADAEFRLAGRRQPGAAVFHHPARDGCGNRRCNESR